MSKIRKRRKERNGQYVEKITGILTDPKLSAIKAMLEKDHAIDCMFLLMLGRGQWMLANEFMKRSGLTLPDGTFRARMIEIEENGLAQHENIDAKKKRWKITRVGREMGLLLLGLLGNMAGRTERLTCN